jgi:predicted nucleic acid-binding protein
MSSVFAIDTNIAIYAFTKDHKRQTAMELLSAGPKISVQLLNEFASVGLRKRKLDWLELEESLDIITRLASSMRAVGYDVHDLARVIAQRYNIGFYDSLFVAAAKLDHCEILYSEDMHHGLVVEDKLTIINPFLEPEPA